MVTCKTCSLPQCCDYDVKGACDREGPPSQPDPAYCHGHQDKCADCGKEPCKKGCDYVFSEACPIGDCTGHSHDEDPNAPDRTEPSSLREELGRVDDRKSIWG